MQCRGWRCVRGLRYRSPTAKSRRHPASGVASFGRLSVVYRIRPIGWRGHAKHVMPRRKSRHLARGKRSATPGIHHPPPSCVRRGRELHIIPGITAQYGRMALNANYLNLQPLRGCGHWGDCRYPHVADCASLIVNMGLLRLQPLRGCAGGTGYRGPRGGGDL